MYVALAGADLRVLFHQPECETTSKITMVTGWIITMVTGWIITMVTGQEITMVTGWIIFKS